MLLDNLTVTGSRGGHQFFGFLIDMNLLFERYVCAALADAAVDWGGELLQQDSRVLDENQTTKVIPDAIFCRDSMPALVIDAKYKLDPGRGDLHQMIAYCHALNLSQAVLVYPDHEDAPAGKLSIRGPGSISVYYLALGLKGGPEQPRWQREELKRNLDPIVAEATRIPSPAS
jgi:5-methylcytosine-specific restriction enzyme subunit McrC